MPRVTAHAALATLVLTLVACGSGPATPASADDATIGGTVQNWPGGTGTVLYNDGSADPQGKITAPVSADGRFSLTLPTPRPERLVSIVTTDPACPLVSGTPSTLRLFLIPEGLQVQVQGTSRQLVELPQDVTLPDNGPPNSTVVRMYTDAPGSAQLTLNCSGYLMTFDLNLHAGWNRVQASVDPATFAVTYRSMAASLATKLVLATPPTVPPVPTPSPSPTPVSPGRGTAAD